MKVPSTGNNKKAGFATLEILIAFGIVILSIGAVIMVVFGNQSISVDSETNNEAIYRAQAALEKARARGKIDFASLVSASSTSTSTIAFRENLLVVDLAQCKKEVTSSVVWNNYLRTQGVEFSTFLGDVAGALALGGDCDTGITDDFDNPGSLVSEGIGGQGATAIDAVNNRIYITSNKFPPLNNSDFMVYDFDSVLASLSPVGDLDLGEGLNDVDVAGNYAYVASASTTGQLQVIDLSTMSRIESAVRHLPETTTAVGRKVFFYDNKLYIGTQYLACPPTCSPSQNNEFHIYDVSTPSSPSWVASVDIDHNVNDIYVSGDFAYLATSDNNRELMIININPSSPDYLEHPDITGLGYNAPGNNDGSSLYVLGSTIYLGRIQNSPPLSAHDFFVLNKIDVLDGSSATDGLSNSLDLGIQNNALVTGIIVRNKLAFIGLDDSNSGLKIVDISTMLPPSLCAGFNFPENSTGMDMGGNFIFTSNSSNDEIQVIYDQPLACS